MSCDNDNDNDCYSNNSGNSTYFNDDNGSLKACNHGSFIAVNDST